MIIKEPAFVHHFYDGILSGEGVEYYEKFYQEIASIYEQEDEQLPADQLMYRVYSYSGESTSNALFWGLTVMEPITVKGECNMTRGHFHADRSQPEIYFGCGGEGLLLLMDEAGSTTAEKIFEGSLHYIKGSLAHRVINTGDMVLKVGACWSSLAGHDYDSVKTGFGTRVFKKEGHLIASNGEQGAYEI